MSDVSQENRIIARTLASAFGGEVKVFRYRDEGGKSRVDIVSSKGSPVPGVTSFATVGLSDTPLYQDSVEFPVRLEMVGACADRYEAFPNALGTSAFNIINSGWFCCPGVIFPDVISEYKLSSTMRHFMFVPPFLWDEKLQTMELDSKTVTWLLAVPISENEMQFSEANGPAKLESLFEECQIDIFDLDRPSVV